MSWQKGRTIVKAQPEEDWEEPARGRIPAAKSFIPVKQEGVERRAGETDRQAQIRAMTEKIRREAREASAGAGPKPPPGAPPGADKPAQPANKAPARPSQPAAQQKPPAARMPATQAQEDKDAARIEKFLPLLQEKVALAEDEAEKVSMLAAPLTMEADEEIRDLQLESVRETERAVRASNTVIAASKREIDKLKTEVARMAPIAKETGETELEKLSTSLAATQAKLDEFKTIRKDHEASIAASKLYGELQQRTAGLEIDAEKAAMMAEPIQRAVSTASASDVSPTELRETKEALRIAQAMLAPTMRLLQGKIAGLKGPMKAKLLELQGRTEASQALLDTAQKTVDECQARAAAVPLLKQTNERLQTVEEIIDKMQATESPFLMGIESFPPEELREVLSKMEAAASLAHSAIADAHKYVSLKMVDVGRLGEAGETVKAEIERVKAKLDESMKTVKQFQVSTQKRKQAALVDGIKSKVEEAASATEKLKELGAELLKADAANTAEVLERGFSAHAAAETAVASARKELQEHQAELKPGEGRQPEALKNSSDVLKTKVRVNYMEADIVKFGKIAKEVEEKQKVEKSLGDVHTNLSAAEVEVGALEEVSKSWPKGERPPEGEDTKILSIQSKLTSTTVSVEQKLQSAQGMELKQLRAIFGRLQRTQWKLDRIKEKVKDLARSVSQVVIKNAADLIQKAERLVAAMGPASQGTTIAAPKIQELNNKSKEAMDAVAEAQKFIAEAQNGGQLGLDAKVEFARLQLRYKATERKCKMVAGGLAARTSKLQQQAQSQTLDVLRAAARKNDVLDAKGLFSDMASGASEISLKQFQDFFAIRAPEIDAEQAELAFSIIAPHGLSLRNFVTALSSYYCCAKDIIITADFEITNAKKVSKLEVGQLVEAFGAIKTDSKLGLDRVQCRVIHDGSSGWVTIKSNTGKVYLEPTSKPYIWCSDTTELMEEQKLSSQKLRNVSPGEVLELIQGPQEDCLIADQRVRGAACHEGGQGWLQIKDKSGTTLAKQSARVFKCVEAIAMTDVADFENCNMVRRIEVDEALEVLADKPFIPEDGGARKHFRACSDGKEGWITTEGSQGTIYVKPAPKHYICSQAAPLHAGLGAESSVVRVLMPGEAFAAFEEPKDVSGAARQKVYLAKTLCGQITEGWVFSEPKSGKVAPWVQRYKVLKATPLSKRLANNEAAETIEVVRLLEPDEILEVAEPPVEDASTGHLRVRAIAKKDRAVGWVTVREGSTAESLLVVPEPNEISASNLAAAPCTPPGDGSVSGGSKGGGKSNYGKAKGPAKGYFR